MSTEQKQFNTNLRTIGAGQNQGPFVVGNVGSFNGRTIFNFGFKTIRTPEGKNATYSVPSDWKKASAFSKGDSVLIDISDDGYIKDVRTAPIQKPNVLTVNKAAQESLDAAAEQHDKAEVETDAAIMADAGTEDLPF